MEAECVQQDFMGTWTGTVSCAFTDKQGEVAITAGKKSNELILNGNGFHNEVVKIDDCELEGIQTVFDIEVQIKGTLVDGHLSIVSDDFTGMYVDLRCEYELTK